MSNVTRGLWFLHFRGCQSLGISKILFRKENGEPPHRFTGAYSQLGIAHPNMTGGITGSELGKGPSDQHGLGSFTSHCYISSYIPSQGGKEGSLDLKVENAP